MGPVYGTATPCRHATWPGAQPAVRWWLSHTYVYMSGVSLGRLLTHPLPDRQQGTDRAWGPRPHLLPQPDVQGGAEKLRAEEALHRGGSLEAEARLGLALCRAPASRLGWSASLTGSICSPTSTLPSLLPGPLTVTHLNALKKTSNKPQSLVLGL